MKVLNFEEKVSEDLKMWVMGWFGKWEQVKATWISATAMALHQEDGRRSSISASRKALCVHPGEISEAASGSANQHWYQQTPRLQEHTAQRQQTSSSLTQSHSHNLCLPAQAVRSRIFNLRRNDPHDGGRRKWEEGWMLRALWDEEMRRWGWEVIEGSESDNESYWRDKFKVKGSAAVYERRDGGEAWGGRRGDKESGYKEESRWMTMMGSSRRKDGAVGMEVRLIRRWRQEKWVKRKRQTQFGVWSGPACRWHLNFPSPPSSAQLDGLNRCWRIITGWKNRVVNTPLFFLFQFSRQTISENKTTQVQFTV